MHQGPKYTAAMYIWSLIYSLLYCSALHGLANEGREYVWQAGWHSGNKFSPASGIYVASVLPGFTYAL